MNEKVKKIIDVMRNKDVEIKDTPCYYHINEESLNEDAIVVMPDDDMIIEEVFEYNMRANKSRIKMYDLREARKGYMKVNPIVFLGILAMLKVLEKKWNDSNIAWIAIAIYVLVYMYTLVKKKFNIYANVISTAILLCVDLLYCGMLVMNVLLCYLYDRSERQVKDELGYPAFPDLDLIIKNPNGGESKRIFAREME